MKKRLFSILLAVVMIATAINLAPVMKVWATGGLGINTKNVVNSTKNYYEWDYPEGHWDSYDATNNSNKDHTGSMTYYNDGDYSKLVGVGGTEPSGHTQVRTDENYRTRQVTMFNDCDPHYNSVMDPEKGANEGTTPVYQVQYVDNTFKTNRGTTGVKTADQSARSAMNRYCSTNQCTESNLHVYQPCTACQKKGWAGHTAGYQTEVLPFLCYGYGCSVNFAKGKEYGNNSANMSSWEGWKNNSFVTFYSNQSDNTGGGDFRMTFRNYYNTDSTTFNPIGQYFSSDRQKQGLSIKEYDYLEFDLLIENASDWTKTRSGSSNTTGYYVYLYSETNCAADEYVNGKDDTYTDNDYKFCIPGWNLSAFNFVDQLEFDSNGNYANKGKWTTIRLGIPKSIKTNASGSNCYVKQITIRMIGGCASNARCISVDNIRFVKNDDHIGKVYTHNSSGNKVENNQFTQYPSGEYFMINDFEFNGNEVDIAFNTNDQKGVVQPYKKGTNTTPEMYRMYRNNEINTSDTMNHFDTTKADDAWNSINWASSNNKIYGGRPNVGVTQGDYATVILARNNVYKTQDGSGTQGYQHLPTYYERTYNQPIQDLSQYTHFAIDVFIRPQKSYNKDGKTQYGIQQYDPRAKGITFSIDLFSEKETDSFRYTKGASVKFLLPYGSECWDAPSDGKVSSYSYGTILPLGENYYGNPGSDYTASGAMRFVFTREELLQYAKGEFDLTNITGMRFCWENRTDTEGLLYTVATDGSSIGSGKYVDIILDNFIAYTPDTSVTIQNQVDKVDTLDGNGQYFVYDIYGGYRSTENEKYINSELGATALGGYDGLYDTITKDVNLTVAVPANGKVTVANIPFNSFYVSQQNWPWRYKLNKIALTQTAHGTTDPYAGATGRQLTKGHSGNTIAILPRVSLDGSNGSNSPIWELMRQRNFTITFTNTLDDDKWLDHNTVDHTNFLPSQK